MGGGAPSSMKSQEETSSGTKSVLGPLGDCEGDWGCVEGGVGRNELVCVGGENGGRTLGLLPLDSSSWVQQWTQPCLVAWLLQVSASSLPGRCGLRPSQAREGPLDSDHTFWGRDPGASLTKTHKENGRALQHCLNSSAQPIQMRLVSLQMSLSTQEPQSGN